MPRDFHDLHTPGWLQAVDQQGHGFSQVTVVTSLGNHATYSVPTHALDLSSQRSRNHLMSIHGNLPLRNLPPGNRE